MLEFFGDIAASIMAPLYYVISAVLVGFMRLFGSLFGEASGVAWVLSIIGLSHHPDRSDPALREADQEPAAR